MTQANPNTLSLSRKILRGLIALNQIYGFLVLALLVGSFVMQGTVLRALRMDAPGAHPSLIIGVRLIMVLGFCAVPVTHIVLSRLLAIVETVRGGDPFVSLNASRLQVIAWAILTLELLHMVIGFTATRVSTASLPITIDGRPSITRWLCVLLLFVLARVFEQGAHMREDLEGTV